MKVTDVKVDLMSIEKGCFVKGYAKRFNYYRVTPDCHVIFIKSDSFNKISYLYFYRGQLPPFRKWYLYRSLPFIVRLISFFEYKENEVFTTKELSSIFTDVDYSALRPTVSAYMSDRIMITSNRKMFYGHKKGLDLLEKHLKKIKVPYQRLKNEGKRLVITIRHGDKERTLTYTY